MTESASNINEQLVANAFNRQSIFFDELYGHDKIIQYKRERVRAHVDKLLQPNSRILELNAGTGEDAIYFASQGHQVHATDIAEGMQEMLRKKIEARGFGNSISTELCSYNMLDRLKDKGPYNFIFSNFAGLNCTGNLEQVLHSFYDLLKPGGIVTMVLLPEFCLWETLLLFRGKFKTAFRRFTGNDGSSSHIDGVYFRCWYYNPSYIVHTLKCNFELLNIEGLCTLVPPSYIVGFSEKHPALFKFLKTKENQLKNTWPWKCIGDYYIISLTSKK